MAAAAAELAGVAGPGAAGQGLLPVPGRRGADHLVLHPDRAGRPAPGRDGPGLPAPGPPAGGQRPERGRLQHRRHRHGAGERPRRQGGLAARLRRADRPPPRARPPALLRQRVRRPRGRVVGVAGRGPPRRPQLHPPEGRRDLGQPAVPGGQPGHRAGWSGPGCCGPWPPRRTWAASCSTPWPRTSGPRPCCRRRRPGTSSSGTFPSCGSARPRGWPRPGCCPSSASCWPGCCASTSTGSPAPWPTSRPSGPSARRWRRSTSAGPAGPEPGQPHYYRIQGPRLLIEYDNVQNGANHVHSVWRDPEGDFGQRSSTG